MSSLKTDPADTIDTVQDGQKDQEGSFAKDTGSMCVLVFVRAPEKGRVKTRLARGIGTGPALRFYKLCVEHSLTTFDATGFPLRIYYHPPGKRDVIASWLGNGHPFFSQEGDHIGARMASAFLRAFEAGFSRAVLVGTDIPGLTSSIIREAFSSMDLHGAAIGPADDGGYYLIGFRSDTFRPGVFSGISWGKKTVFWETIARFKAEEISVYTLPRLTDIDTLEDLLNYAGQAQDGSFLSRWASGWNIKGGC